MFREITLAERIGEYLLGRLLGEGGMGRVYEAEERLTGRRVALKVLREDLAWTREGRRQFLSEMRILAHLEHPNIVRSLTSFEADGRLAAVLEYLDGHTLRAELQQRGNLPWYAAASIALQVTRALAHAHCHQPPDGPIIHRDLKPENIMLLTNGGAKVMDFGIAKVLQTITRAHTYSGTLQYMSPEQIDGLPLGPAADLYQLGLVLYEMLAGRPPFESESPRALMEMQCTQPPPKLPADILRGCPTELVGLTFSLLQKQAAKRPSNAARIISSLETLLATTTGTEQSSSTTAAIDSTHRSPKGTDTSSGGSRRLRSRPLDTLALIERAGHKDRRPWVAVALLVVVVGVAGFALWTQQSSQRAEAVPHIGWDTAPSTASPESVGAPAPSPPARADKPNKPPSREPIPSAPPRRECLTLVVHSSPNPLGAPFWDAFEDVSTRRTPVPPRRVRVGEAVAVACRGPLTGRGFALCARNRAGNAGWIHHDRLLSRLDPGGDLQRLQGVDACTDNVCRAAECAFQTSPGASR